VTVLTNDLVVARDVAVQPDNRVVLLGGDLDPAEMAVYGALALDDLQRFHVDRLFAELDGFGDGLELSCATQQKAALIRAGREHAREFVMLCLAERFFRNAFFRFGTASPGDTVVTDRTLADEAKRKLFGANLRLFTALDVFEGSA
jgi:DeoR/GlpR family transcriptional regulator of sugar metabolism